MASKKKSSIEMGVQLKGMWVHCWHTLHVLTRSCSRPINNDVFMSVDCDQTLLLLLCDSVLLFHHEDKELVSLVEKTYNIVHDQLQGICDITEQLSALQDIKKGVTLNPRSFTSGRETCPACDGKVKLETEDHATCANGHLWLRCSVTLLLVADFHPRTCLGCRRKTLMVPGVIAGAPVLPGSTSSSWLEVVLRASSVCCFCGERYTVF